MQNYESRAVLGKAAKDAVQGPVLLPLAVTPWAACVLSLPASCSRCPSCSQGLRRLTGQLAARQGDPAPRHQVPLPVPATPSRPSPRGRRQGPRGLRGETPPLQAAIGKRSLALTLDPQPLQGAAQALARGGGVSQPRRGSPGEQPGAEVRVLQRVGLLLRGHRPHLAGLDPRGPGTWGRGQPGATRR